MEKTLRPGREGQGARVETRALRDKKYGGQIIVGHVSFGSIAFGFLRVNTHRP
jgi:hypothetical protein